VLVRHVLRNSLFGLLTLVGLNLGTLIGGTVIIEEIFALPGIGQELIQAIDVRDVIVVEAIVTVLAIAVVAASLLTDLLYAILDPRIRL
jgi:peptide/nickel transport system permease protein